MKFPNGKHNRKMKMSQGKIVRPENFSPFRGGFLHFALLISLFIQILGANDSRADEFGGAPSGSSDAVKVAQAVETNDTPGVSASAKGKANIKGDGGKDAKSKSAKAPSLPNNLKDVVSYAITHHPQIGIARARLGEAKAGIMVVEAGNGILIDGTLGTGYGAQSTNTLPFGNELFQQPYFGQGNRYVLSLTGKKILYDFGSIDKYSSRAMRLASAEEFNLNARMIDIGQAMAQAYINVVATRELARLNQENISALEEIENLVQLNQTNGNGTVADVKRVEARLVDARTVAADNQADFQNAIDRFQRLVKAEPGELKPVPDLADYTPAAVETAIALLPKTSPKLRAGELSRRAAEIEIEAKKASGLPVFSFQTDTTVKSYTGTIWNNFDAQAMVSMTYKFTDGGLAQGQIAQLLARYEQEESRYNFDRDEAEADLRKFYTTIASARSKTASLAEGVEASKKARDLYKEQFQGGKRTLFELLDIQTAAFNAERSAVLNMFEERRAIYGVLSTIGVFIDAVNGQHNALVAENGSTLQTVKKKKNPL